MNLKRRGARIYEIALAILGVGAASLIFTRPWIVGVQHEPVQFLLLTVLVLLGELNPVTMTRRGRLEEIFPSTAFAFAILLSRGAGAAMAVQVFAALSADFAKDRPVRQVVANVSRRAITLAAAGYVLEGFGDARPMGDLHIGVTDVVPLALATIAFFVVTSLIIAVDSSIG